jgi:thioredoxin reductase
MEEQSKGDSYDVVVIGAGPAGLAASIAAFDKGANTLIVERESRAGGILKQCIHDGFGTITFNEKLSGPEYAERYIKEVKSRGIRVLTSTYVTKVEKQAQGFKIDLVNSKSGVFQVTAKTVILANGCRERTSKQVFITGTRPAGVYTAGTAQYFVNILGYLPCKKCVILGSGDIGLIMARRLTLEGAEVLGVYEAKSTPSGLSRNIAQCLEDYSIPLYLSHTITKIIGTDRVEGVEISEVDEKMEPIAGTEERLKCDGVILSVGIIPENELAESLGVIMDKSTKGPQVDESFMTSVQGVFSCGNALHVNDLVDYVSESGTLAGEAAADFIYGESEKEYIYIEASKEDFLYVVPQRISNNKGDKKTTIYFRSKNNEHKVEVKLMQGSSSIFTKSYEKLKPPEMERIEINLNELIKEEELTHNIQLVMSR